MQTKWRQLVHRYFLFTNLLILNVDKPWESAIDNQLKMNSDIQTDLQTDLQILILYYQVRFPFPTGLIVIYIHIYLPRTMPWRISDYKYPCNNKYCCLIFMAHGKPTAVKRSTTKPRPPSTKSGPAELVPQQQSERPLYVSNLTAILLQREMTTMVFLRYGTIHVRLRRWPTC